ncbi:carboxylate--amine ligase [Actinomadura rudentiformis]|uniref:ATP-grasp domain-containing protein n=1 Tax=Actinomadura rudentiformis TaxID=359158 RepID=A0A6H9Z0A0_9ACTN|nr:ATP-grasp domain-containing protein [Actinomadura rudentiformis]KAB2350135.1 ATP-grasp domain-containing protein [Actinomadura rudentiformis]
MGRDFPQLAEPELDCRLPVLLLRTSRYPLHHGTLAAIRSLGRAGIEVHAILEPGITPAGTSRYLHRCHGWGPPPHLGGSLARYLEGIAERIGRPTLLIALDDAGAIYIAENAGELKTSFVFPPQWPGTPRMVADKATLLEAGQRNGIAMPPSRIPATGAELRQAVGMLGLPLIAKWARPWLLPTGLRSTTLVTSLQQAQRLLGRAHDPANQAAGPLILQRRIPSAGGDWFFHGYFDASSRCLFGGTGRKHVARPAHAGHTVAGEWVLNPRLERLAHEIVSTLGYTGLVDLDFRLDTERTDRSDPDKGGTYHLLDFNPRLGAQFRLFQDRQCLDLVRALHLDQSGRAVPRPRPAPGRTLIVENQYAQHALASFTRPLSKIRRGRRADELAWWAADDPRPFFVMGKLSLAGALTSARPGRRRR